MRPPSPSSGRPHSARPMKSQQRVGRRSHHAGGTRVAEPPLDARAPCERRRRRKRFIARSVDFGGSLTRGRLDFQHAEHGASSRPSPTAVSVSLTSARASVGQDAQLGELRARRLLLGERLVQVCQRVCCRCSLSPAVTAGMRPTLECGAADQEDRQHARPTPDRDPRRHRRASRCGARSRFRVDRA